MVFVAWKDCYGHDRKRKSGQQNCRPDFLYAVSYVFQSMILMPPLSADDTLCA